MVLDMILNLTELLCGIVFTPTFQLVFVLNVKQKLGLIKLNKSKFCALLERNVFH